MDWPTNADELLDPAGLSRLQRNKLVRLWDDVVGSSRFYQRKFAGLRFDPRADALATLPLTRRSELERDQLEHPPYGSVPTCGQDQFRRLHQTSGSSGVPLRWLDTEESWRWFKACWGIVYRGVGLRPSDRLFFPFSFGPFIGFWGAFEAAAELGCFCLPAGGMTTAARLRLLLDHDATVVCCTPTYALRLADEARDQGLDLPSSSVRLLIVAGEPGGGVASIRERLARGWGSRVADHAGMTEMGAWGFECQEQEGGLHVIESEFIAEVIDPRTGGLIEDGGAGELVLTNLGRNGMPLIRYRTGDRVVLGRGRCACGRWFARAEGGIVGRIDDMLSIRGNNVFPSAIEAIVGEFADVAEFRLLVDQAGALSELTIEIEPKPGSDGAGLGTRVSAAIRDRLHFRPGVSVVAVGTLPRSELKSRRVIRRGFPAAGDSGHDRRE